MDDKTKAFYIRLREELITTTPQWPAEYLYKFIVPTDVAKISEIERHFNGMGAVIDTIQSKTGKYTSVSVNVVMQSADHIIEKYVAVSHIEGIVSL